MFRRRHLKLRIVHLNKSQCDGYKGGGGDFSLHGLHVRMQCILKMQMSDNCAICRRSKLHGILSRVAPCRHHFHRVCLAPIMDNDNPACPLCRTMIESIEKVEHKEYSRYIPHDRQRIVECAQHGGDWKNLANSLNVNYKTAYGLVRSGESSGNKRGGYKSRYLNEEQIAEVLNEIEADPEKTLSQLKDFISQQFQINLAISTIGNYLDGQLYTIKKFHHQPTTMNSDANKQLRKRYVESLNAHIQEEKEIIWMDETNFNLFCR